MARDRLVFFATDLHGSEACFRKFLSAGRVYGADTLIMGGDVTGKAIVPVHPAPHGYVARWRDSDHELATAAELGAFVRAVADAGGYAWLAERDEAAAVFADAGATEALLARLAAERVRAWVRLADERLTDRVQGFAMPGNDDTTGSQVCDWAQCCFRLRAGARRDAVGVSQCATSVTPCASSAELCWQAKGEVSRRPCQAASATRSGTGAADSQACSRQ